MGGAEPDPTFSPSASMSGSMINEPHYHFSMSQHSASSEIYSSFIALLSSVPPQVLELDILPSSFPQKIHSATPSIALTKPLLASLFLTARHVFFSYLSSHRKNNCGSEEEQKNDQTPSSEETSLSYTAALHSTMIILLWDPNHLTTANFRKRHLFDLASPSPSHHNLPLGSRPSTSSAYNPDLLQALIAELSFLTSLLTSPLPKHTKSPTLWSHRLFLLLTFGAEISILILTNSPPFYNNADDNDEISSRSLPLVLWNHELGVILKAGDRHPQNYYAWNYARQLFAALSTGAIILINEEAREEDQRDGIRKLLTASSIAVVQKWCLSHPRDISGWTFLQRLLKTGTAGREHQRAGIAVDDEPRKLKNDGEGAPAARNSAEGVDEARRVVQETKEFVRKFRWRGASVEWFLRAMGDVDRANEG